MADKPVLDLLARMTADSLEVSSLDPESIMLVRIAALISVDAPPASYLLNLGMASEIDIDAEQVRAVLSAAVAPIVGTARVASAAGNIARGPGIGARSCRARGGSGGRRLEPHRPCGSPAAGSPIPTDPSSAASGARIPGGHASIDHVDGR